MKFRIMIVLSSLLLLPQLAAATDKTIDKRTYSDAHGNQFFVVFCARGGFPGHAFVVWGSEDYYLRMSTQAAWGFYPDPAYNPIFGPVPGVLQNDALMGSLNFITDRLIVRVDEQVYHRSQVAILNWQTTNYMWYAQNCISFDMDVASRVGLKVPAKGITTRPSDYLTKLINAN